MSRNGVCRTCGGKGTVWSHTKGTQVCPACNGSGSTLGRAA